MRVYPTLYWSGAVLLPLAAHAAAAQEPRMNVLFIAVDDLKPVLGCYGDSFVKSPNIDALANRGSVFQSAYCQQAVSGPTRASLMTGLRPDKTEIWDLKTLIRDKNPKVVTMPQYFKEQGYETIGIGKIYDQRSVDKQDDQPSWSVPYLNFKNYLSEDYGELLGGRYIKAETRELGAKYEEEGKKKGLKGSELDAYVAQFAKPSVECVDVPDDVYKDGAVAKGAVEALKKYGKQSKPFFLAVGFAKPHLPFAAPKKYWDLYDRQQVSLAQFKERAANSPEIAYTNAAELTKGYSDIPPLVSFSDINNVILPESKERELIHGYYACVSYTDAMVGQVLATLKEQGLDKNTIVVLWGDHGWHLGDHGMWCKHTNFENATHVPLIIVDPRYPSGKSRAMAEFVDIYPTLCQMLQLPTPSHLDGQSLLPIVQGKATDVKEYAVSQYPRAKGIMGYSLRTKQYRYVEWMNGDFRTSKDYNSKNVVAYELYDYVNDPLEKVSVADKKEMAAVRAQLADLLHKHYSDQKASYVTFKESIK